MQEYQIPIFFIIENKIENDTLYESLFYKIF